MAEASPTPQADRFRAGLRQAAEIVGRLVAEERRDAADIALIAPEEPGRGLVFRVRDLAGPFRRHDRRMWSAAVPELAHLADDAARRDGGPLFVFEDGRLSGADGDPEVIRGGAIRFSTPDGSDPNDNGRSYRLLHPAAAAGGPLRLHDGMTVVFAGTLREYWASVASGLLPEFAEVRLADGTRRLRAARVPTARGSEGAMRSEQQARRVRAGMGSRIAAGLERSLGARTALLRAALLGLAGRSWARRAQPFVDRRENALARLLAGPGEFPYRLRHVVNGRVVLAISSLHNGGAERQIVYTAAGLGQRGFGDVHILAEYLRNPGNDFYLADALNAALSVTEVPDGPNPASDWLRAHPELVGIVHANLANRILNIAEYLQRLSPEVVHAGLDWTNIAVGLAAALAGVPHIFVSGRNLAPWHFGFFNWFMYPAYRALLSRPNVTLLNNTEAGARDYAAWLRIPAERIGVLRNGIDLRRFRPADPARRLEERDALGVPRTARLIAGAFRFSDEKRPLLWIEAAAKIHRQDANAWFVVCGAGPLGDTAKRLARDLGIGERTVFPGVVQDMSRVYAAADLIMLASLKEGTPNVLIEAQAMGVPVLATAAYGSAETVEDGVTGRILRNETADALAAAALALLGDAPFRERARQAGPHFVERRFGLARMADDTLALYRAAGAAFPAPAPGALREPGTGPQPLPAMEPC